MVEAQVRVAVIGNGPSAKGLGGEIDLCDFVVRCGQWTAAFPKRSAGTKLSAWAWPGYSKMNRYLPKGKGWQMWITCPWTWHKGKERLRNVTAVSNRRRLHVLAISLPQYMAARKYLNRLIPSRTELPPTTGLLAIHMALGLKPAEMLIAGFDARSPGSPGFRYADGRKLRSGPHHMATEKILLQELFEGSWLGNDSDVLVDWRQL